MKTGFIIGKFYPFHLGHMRLIDVALAHCDHLIVWVCEKATQEIPGHIRAAWISELYPEVEVRLVPDTLGDDDTPGWAAYTLRVLGRAPDIVFSSEDYGEPYAKAMGSEHFMVDRERTGVHISATMIRGGTHEHWDYLAPPMRAYFAKRVVLVGAESTGTTTLTQALAAYYRTLWVPEYGREYSSKKLERGETSWNSNEFIHIAREQSRREDESARSANRLLVADTDAFATSLWHERYMGTMDAYLGEIARRRIPDLYILTGDEIPFVQDGLRDGEHIRNAMHTRFEQELRHASLPFLLVRGPKAVRLHKAVQVIDRLQKLPKGHRPSQSDIDAWVMKPSQ